MTELQTVLAVAVVLAIFSIIILAAFSINAKGKEEKEEGESTTATKKSGDKKELFPLIRKTLTAIALVLLVLILVWFTFWMFQSRESRMEPLVVQRVVEVTEVAIPQTVQPYDDSPVFQMPRTPGWRNCVWPLSVTEHTENLSAITVGGETAIAAYQIINRTAEPLFFKTWVEPVSEEEVCAYR